MNLIQSETFRKWLEKLRDERAKGLIAAHLHRPSSPPIFTAHLHRPSSPPIFTAHLHRLSDGHAGDAQGVGDGVSELRIHHGPGYRVYYHQDGDTIILLLCGGDKSSQAKDIGLAKRLLTEWRLHNG
ncbi:type II toxin-antitoxin system RelE/ParE family toxin [Pararhizobium sp. O133]|uniref:type II toxin-antitoxin system RelE/ParE family toxin n=1 Tax=Pararhizobium sp. O133 TaxID=3449278 RepID=UPI003F686C7C